MTQEQLIKIIEEQKDLKNLPNSNLIQMNFHKVLINIQKEMFIKN